jgi:hypothetical protein
MTSLLYQYIYVVLMTGHQLKPQTDKTLSIVGAHQDKPSLQGTVYGLLQLATWKK